MLNGLWAGMMILGILYGAFQGRLADITNAALESSKEAVTLCITMAGVMAFWMGLMEVAAKAGMIQVMERLLSPIIRFFFPNIPEKHPAKEYITTNFVANIFGLGWAATPAGLKAMDALHDLEEARRRGNAQGRAMPAGVANNEMCTFLILNISSLQLIPIQVIGYRGQYGSVNPVWVIGPALLATSISTLTAALYCRWKNQ